MVITSLIGGLGNQMFQYAAGRALSLRRGVPLMLDVSGFANYQLHQGFELERLFNCKVEMASEREVRRVLRWQFTSGVRRVLSRPSMAALRRKSFVIEPYFHYWDGIKTIPSDCYLAGYWQSYKYFSGVAEEIRDDFSFRIPLECGNIEIATQINEVNSVSLHVRRGDYISTSKNVATYGVCSLDYYRAAIKSIADRVQCPNFFVFSDDPVWVRNNLKIEFNHQYIDHNHGKNSYNDMRLMSLCKHHIIANSSFSWWGAWLNPSVDKIVVAPERWFSNGTNTKDLLPIEWVRL